MDTVRSSSALLWSNLNILTKDRYDAILQVFESLDEAAEHVNEEFLRGLGCKEETAMKVLNRKDEFDQKAEEAALREYGVRFLVITDEEYPEKLRHIADPPVFLYVRGDLSLLEQPCIGLVGTRQMGPYGRRITQDFTPDMVRAGMVTVSGLALGIDALVAEETLKAGGKTVAVLGHGLARIYPRENAALGERIVAKGGLLLSEFPLRMEPDRYTFPARNRIIAGVSLATVVLEAPEGSGAIITADLAFDYNRPVFAVPGPIYDDNYKGCNALIARGKAKLVQSAAEVLTEMGVIVVERPAGASSYQAQSPSEEKLLSVLTSLPQPVDDLVEKSGLSASDVGAALTMMELLGGAKNVGAGMWVKI